MSKIMTVPPFPERLSSDHKLYMVFNAFDEESACWSYREGVLSMKVTRKGAVINTLDANWLDLTTFYYKQGLSLVDAFVSWETPKGELYLSNTSVCKSSGCASKPLKMLSFKYCGL